MNPAGQHVARRVAGIGPKAGVRDKPGKIRCGEEWIYAGSLKREADEAYRRFFARRPGFGPPARSA